MVNSSTLSLARCPSLADWVRFRLARPSFEEDLDIIDLDAAGVDRLRSDVRAGRLRFKPGASLRKDVRLRRLALSMVASYDVVVENPFLDRVEELITSAADVVVAGSRAEEEFETHFEVGFLEAFLLFVCWNNNNRVVFLPDAGFKSTKDVLDAFSGQVLEGEGELPRRLQRLGVLSSRLYAQMPWMDFDYIGLCDGDALDVETGVALVKILAGEAALSEARLDAGTRLLRLRNAKLVTKDEAIARALSERDAAATLDALWRGFYAAHGVRAAPFAVLQRAFRVKKYQSLTQRAFVEGDARALPELLPMLVGRAASGTTTEDLLDELLLRHYRELPTFKLIAKHYRHGFSPLAKALGAIAPRT